MTREPKQQKPNQPRVESAPPDDDLLMGLVESALACPLEEREAFTRSACPDPEVFAHVWKYVERERLLGEFLLDPLYRPGYPEQPFEPGEVLEDRFRIVGEAARGGMGIVYDAFDEKLERRIAIKCARAGFGRSLPPEVRHASEVSHPNVCKIYEIHTAHTPRGNIDFITMEFLEGETLAARMVRDDDAGKTPVARGLVGAPPREKAGFRLPRRQAMAIGRQITAGLAAAHQVGLVHGDLKSNNIILATGMGGLRAVITDFGLARRAAGGAPDGRSSQIGGAPDYMAPELLKGGKPSFATDVYGLGVILYELMAGHRPFPANLPRESRLRLMPGPAHSPWDRLLARCLDPDPARRPANAAAVQEAITPNRGRLWRTAAAAVLALAASAAIWGYRAATAPEESLRLALLPVVQPGPDLAADAVRLFTELKGKVGSIHGNHKRDFSVLRLTPAVDTIDEARKATATHVLTVQLSRKDGQLVVDSFLRDLVTNTRVWQFKATYQPAELHLAPVALAGFVTESLHLPPLAAPSMSAGAKLDYDAALELLRQRSQLDKALELLDRAVLVNPDSALIWAALAEAQQLKSTRIADPAWMDRARGSFNNATLRNPDLAPVHRIGGLLSLRAGKQEQAVGHYLRAIELDPADSEGYRRLGSAYTSGGQTELASAALDQAVKADPASHLARWERGRGSLIVGQYAQAAADLLRASELAPNDPGPLIDLAEAYLCLGQFIKAENVARQSLELQRNGATLSGLARTLLYQSKELEAIPYLKEGIAVRPQAIYFVDLDTAYRRVRRDADAKATETEGLKLAREESRRDYRDGWARARVAYFAARLKDSQTALTEIAQALEFAPASAEVRFLAALTYETLGLRDKALAVLDGAGLQALNDLSRWPDLADLARDPRFTNLVARKQSQTQN